MSDFQEGDVVQLKSGGQRMTVESVEDGSVDCVWSEGSTIHRASFSEKTLTKAGPGVATARLSRG